jgi:transposase
MHQAILSLQGIGRLTAAVIWAAIGDPARFPNTRYVGFDPSVFQSGDINRNGHVNCHGPSIVRTYAVEAVKWIIRSREDRGA